MSAETPTFDQALGHRQFSAGCFNRTWTLIDKPDRTPADDEAMILCTLASLWHWTQRADCTERNLSIGHWQAARVYALVGQGENAMRHALRSLRHAEGFTPFYVGYAHEACARAALVLNDLQGFREHAARARASAAAVEDAGQRAELEKDLRELDARAAGAAS